ncbi:MAG TPA: right-handed parallel beta-helix repeat-containing protein, partial [Polyangiaceae bacterium]|nr:right-handed parallel beta-helix repeat-containing protein [Polyangiaceae bacterium]
RAQEVPTAYELELLTSCPLEAAEAWGRNLATGAVVKSRSASSELLARLPRSRLGPDATPALVAGEVAPHPWQLEEPAHEPVSIGPGRVAISETRVFEADQPVTVRAGTRLEMAPDASLIFLGSVQFEGTSRKPIEIVPARAEPWGGLVIRGAASAGSGLHGVHLRGGTRPHYGSGDYPALVDVHDSRDISIDDCDFAAPGSPNDTLHLAYVEAARVNNCHFDAGPEDALDLEFSEVDLRQLRIVGSGDDGLDLMGSRVNVTDSVILSTKGNGISCGEGSEVRVRDSLIADCGVGVLAKNAGHASLSESVLYHNGTGLRSYQRTVRYAGASDLRGSRLFVAESVAQPLERSDRAGSALDSGELQLSLPLPGALEHLRSDVLGLENWQALAEFVSHEKAQALR